MYKQILVNEKSRIGKRSKKTELTGRILRRGRSSLECSSVQEEEDEAEEEEV